MTHLYFIKAGNLTKVGIAQNVWRRFKQIAYTSSVPCKCIGVIPNINREFERSMHNRLWDYHHHGEWFNLPEEILQEISPTQRCLFSISD